MKFVLAVVLAGAACGGAPSKPLPAAVQATLAITNVRVFDGERVLPRATVLVDGARIVEVGPGLAVPTGAEVVDGTNRTLLPGLIDAHAHVWDAGQLEQSLVFGVTTLLDMFSMPATVFPLRDQPRPERAELRSAGILATAPNGHGTEYGFEIPTITKPDQAKAFVDARFAEGSDYLKIVFDNGSAYDKPIPTVDSDTLHALVNAAHAREKLAVVHIGTYDEARTAINRGADGIVHLFRDKAPAADFGAFVARKGAFVTPTLSVLRTLQGKPSPIGTDAALEPYLGADAKTNLVATLGLKAKATPEAAELAIAQLRDANVPILVGTDAPNPGTTHGASVHDELQLLVAAGLPATTALAGATSLPAKRFKLVDRGRIVPGMRADLVLVDGDPTVTITDTRRIVAVWHAGAKLDREAYQSRIASPASAPTNGGGLVSDFETTLAPHFGQTWVTSTDAMLGGTSTATLTIVPGGAAGSKQALAIEGTVVAHQPASWSGAMWSPGPRAFTATDLSANKQLRFSAKADGKPYTVMVFSQSRGRAPVVKAFTPGKDFTNHAFAWAEFDGLDGKDIMAILIGTVEPGPFKIVIDNVELK